MTTTQTITPQTLYDQLQRAAELSQQPLTAVIQQSLSHSLPPLLEEIPPEYQTAVYPLSQMDITQLQQEMRRVFPKSHWRIYEKLLDKKKQTPLTKQAQAALAKLQYEANVLMFRKGYAAILLKRRGYAIPSPNDLPIVQ